MITLSKQQLDFLEDLNGTRFLPPGDQLMPIGEKSEDWKETDQAIAKEYIRIVKACDEMSRCLVILDEKSCQPNSNQTSP